LSRAATETTVFFGQLGAFELLHVGELNVFDRSHRVQQLENIRPRLPDTHPLTCGAASAPAARPRFQFGQRRASLRQYCGCPFDIRACFRERRIKREILSAYLRGRFRDRPLAAIEEGRGIENPKNVDVPVTSRVICVPAVKAGTGSRSRWARNNPPRAAACC
jgi:hypothetical protein